MASDQPDSHTFLPIQQLLNWLHLIYLGVLPALATFALLAGWPRPEWQRPLIFMGGVALVGVYQAVVFSYSGTSKRIWPLLFVLLDGPLFVWLGGGSIGDEIDFAVRAFLIDGLAIWLVIAFLALSTDRPTSGQRVGSVGFAVVAMTTLMAISWPFLAGLISNGLGGLGWLAAGVIEAITARYLLLEKDEPVANPDRAAFFIAVMVIFWIAAMIAGSVAGDLR